MLYYFALCKLENKIRKYYTILNSIGDKSVCRNPGGDMPVCLRKKRKKKRTNCKILVQPNFL